LLFFYEQTYLTPLPALLLLFYIFFFLFHLLSIVFCVFFVLFLFIISPVFYMFAFTICKSYPVLFLLFFFFFIIAVFAGPPSYRALTKYPIPFSTGALLTLVVLPC